MYKPGPSTIHGIGLFSTASVASGSLIGSFEGFTAKDLDHEHVLCVDTADGNWIALHITNDLKYLNHSVDPTVEVFGLDVYATRDIEPGEELTFDYGWGDDEDD